MTVKCCIKFCRFLKECVLIVFFILKTQWFNEITPFEIIPNEEFINEIKLVVPNFKYKKITYNAVYSGETIKNQVAFSVLNDYEHNYSKYHSNAYNSTLEMLNNT